MSKNNLSNIANSNVEILPNPNVHIYTTGVIQDATSVKYVGFVTASLVVSRNMFSTMGSGFKSLVGGRLVGQTKMMRNYRAELVKELTDKANALGANAVIAIRIDVDDVNSWMSFFGYATAVMVEHQ